MLKRVIHMYVHKGVKMYKYKNVYIFIYICLYIYVYIYIYVFLFIIFLCILSEDILLIFLDRTSLKSFTLRIKIHINIYCSYIYILIKRHYLLFFFTSLSISVLGIYFISNPSPTTYTLGILQII